ncbi:MAG: bacteriohemerythrin [Candidatus Solibacter sp.]|nr:bacteriohemerythrin [Candidatus Solibacter sp.]
MPDLKYPARAVDKVIMFEWKNEFAVNIGSIDSQHQNLFAIGRELHAAMSTGQGKSVLGPILDRLVQYTSAHFAYEERLLQLHKYPDFAAHKAQHDALVKQVVAFQTDFKTGKISMAVPVLLFVKDWLEKHIQGTDLAYVPCLKAQKVA